MSRTRARDAVAAAVVLLLGRRKPPPPDLDGEERIVPEGPPDRRAELWANALLLAAAVCAAAFVAVYALDRLPNQTQLLGASLGLALLLIAAALIVIAKRLIVNEELEEQYSPEHPEEQEEIAQLVDEAGDRITRKRMLKVSFGAAGGALLVALVAPAASLGPLLGTRAFTKTPWRRGRLLVDEGGKPYRASEIEQDLFYTAFPQGADKEALASPVVLVRLPPKDFRLPEALRGYPAQGVVAYSAICTHAGCAIKLYRAPLFQPYEPKPALVCPCHYSSFDPATGGTVVYGPAGRKLPMLPLAVDRAGMLRAGGNFDEPPGPSWWGVRMKKPT